MNDTLRSLLAANGSDAEPVAERLIELAREDAGAPGALTDLLSAIHGRIVAAGGLDDAARAGAAAVEQYLALPDNPIRDFVLEDALEAIRAAAVPSPAPTSAVRATGPTVDDLAKAFVDAEIEDDDAIERIGELARVLAESATDGRLRAEFEACAAAVTEALEKPEKLERSADLSHASAAIERATFLLEMAEPEPDAPAAPALAPISRTPGKEAAPPPLNPSAAPAATPTPDAEPLTVPADADLSLVNDFCTESLEYLDAAENALLVLETNPGDLEAVNVVFRGFHTLKGTSAFIGLGPITKLAHHAESLLSRIRDGAIQCTGGYADLALRSVDALRELVSTARTLPAGGSAGPFPREIALLPDLANADAYAAGSVRGVPREAAPAAELAAAADNGSKAAPARGVNPGENTVRVRTDRLDALVDLIGELVIAQSMLSEDPVVRGGGSHSLAKKVTQATKIVRELQDLSMAVRMVPLKATFQKMARLVRDLATKSGKQVEFVTAGDDTEIDRNMVDVIADPLVHMIRNAVDHGVEGPADRESAGKRATGLVRLSAYHAGGNIVIELADDGRGLNRDRILAKAVEKGLVAADAQLRDREIYDLIFAPGFSTAEKITDVSGRGVGMDVVRKNVEALRGAVEINSVPGHGTTFKIRLPLTLAITDGMLVRVGAERYIIPTMQIHQSFRPTSEMISTAHGRGEMVLLRKDLMPIVRLHRLFGHDGAEQDPAKALLVIVGDGSDRRCAILVDELLGQHQVVAKSLGERVGKVHGVSGGAILADGRVGLILDMPEILGLAERGE